MNDSTVGSLPRRVFRRSGYSVFPLGLGCMRFPALADGSNRTDHDRAVQLIRYAIDKGIDYLDTAWPYCGGDSEAIVGQALQDGYADRVRIATKLPTWLVNDASDVDRYLNEQLDRLNTDTIDFYLVHALKASWWRRLLENGVMDNLEQQRRAGRIRHLGFSFHDGAAAFAPILEGWNWDFALLQYNIMDEHYQAGEAGLRLATERGVDVIIMEPLRGGRLTSTIPAEIQHIWNELPPGCSPAKTMLRWVLDRPGVVMALSGMSDEAQIDENVAAVKSLADGGLTNQERDVIARVRDAYRTRITTRCTDCGYCLPCPAGVHIPRVLSLYDDARAYEALETSRQSYREFVPEEARGDRCTTCGACEKTCPQKVEIQRHLRDGHELLKP